MNWKSWDCSLPPAILLPHVLGMGQTSPSCHPTLVANKAATCQAPRAPEMCPMALWGCSAPQLPCPDRTLDSVRPTPPKAPQGFPGDMPRSWNLTRIPWGWKSGSQGEMGTLKERKSTGPCSPRRTPCSPPLSGRVVIPPGTTAGTSGKKEATRLQALLLLGRWGQAWGDRYKQPQRKRRPRRPAGLLYNWVVGSLPWGLSDP